MLSVDHLPKALQELYEIHEWRHATAILATDFPNEWADIVAVLGKFKLHKSDVIAKGGRKSPVATSLDSEFYARDWVERRFDTKIQIDADMHDSPTHKVDCFKNRVALEV